MGRQVAAGRSQPQTIAGTFWLSRPLTPVSAWNLLATLRSRGPAFTPTWFRAGATAHARLLGRRGETLAVTALSEGGEVQLLRRAGQVPRLVLQSVPDPGGSRVRIAGPPPETLAEGMALIELVRDLCDVLRPRAAIVDSESGAGVRSHPASFKGRGPAGNGAWVSGEDHGGSNPGSRARRSDSAGTGVVRERDGSPVSRVESGAATGAERPHPFPGWITILGPGKVQSIGASRILMAPVFLIDTLSDGGLLIAATPLPWDACRHPGRRSTGWGQYLRPEVWWPGAPSFNLSEAFLRP